MNDKKKEFEKYLNYFNDEITNLKTCYDIYIYLIELSNKNNKEMNEAPCFFQYTIHSFITNLIVSVYRLYDPNKSAKTIEKLLNFIKSNYKTIFHPNRKVKLDEINMDIKKNSDHEDHIKIIKKYRDKYYAHNDKKYFGDFKKLVESYPLDYSIIENLINITIDIYQKYYKAYYGELMPLEYVNCHDIKHIIYALRKQIEQRENRKSLGKVNILE